MKVLIVDDCADVRERLAASLRGLRIETREAHGPAEALACINSFTPDLVVLDLHMPGGSGLELLPRITTSASSPAVIVWSNDAGDHLRRWCLSHGAAFFFDKAKDEQELLDVITEIGRARRR